jgi:DNA-binding response OmpR family regulator
MIVDDNSALAENIAEALAAHGLEAIVAGSEREVISQHALTKVALVDLRLPDASGLDVAQRLAARDPRTKIMFMTAYDEEARRAVADEHGSADLPCIEKPFDVEHLVERIRQAANS